MSPKHHTWYSLVHLMAGIYIYTLLLEAVSKNNVSYITYLSSVDVYVVVGGCMRLFR